MWIYDLKTLRFLEVNEAAVKHYGYSHAEFMRMRLQDIRPKEDITRIKAHLRAKRQRLQFSGEWRHLKKDGTLIYVEIVSHMLIFKGRKSALIVAKDITESKQAYSALKESQPELKDVIHSAMDAIILMDEHRPRGTIQSRCGEDIPVFGGGGHRKIVRIVDPSAFP